MITGPSRSWSWEHRTLPRCPTPTGSWSLVRKPRPTVAVISPAAGGFIEQRIPRVARKLEAPGSGRNAAGRRPNTSAGDVAAAEPPSAKPRNLPLGRQCRASAPYGCWPAPRKLPASLSSVNGNPRTTETLLLVHRRPTIPPLTILAVVRMRLQQSTFSS